MSPEANHAIQGAAPCACRPDRGLWEFGLTGIVRHALTHRIQFDVGADHNNNHNLAPVIDNELLHNNHNKLHNNDNRGDATRGGGAAR
jgi:hypothetical protein